MCALNSRRAFQQRPVICYVTDRHSLGACGNSSSVDSLLRKIEEGICSSVDWVQIREKDLSAKELTRIVREGLRIAAKSSGSTRATRVLVNDRLDVALAERARGVHLGETSVSVADAKKLLQDIAETHGFQAATNERQDLSGAMGSSSVPQDFLVGMSCHSGQVAEAAVDSGADYIFFGPVFPTPSKAGFGPAQGLNRLAEVCRAISVPVVAIGGITVENAASCIAAGAAGIAAIRLFQDATEVTRRVAALRDALAIPNQTG